MSDGPSRRGWPRKTGLNFTKWSGKSNFFLFLSLCQKPATLQSAKGSAFPHQKKSQSVSLSQSSLPIIMDASLRLRWLIEPRSFFFFLLLVLGLLQLDDMSHFNSPIRLSTSLIKHLKHRVRLGSNPLQSRSFTSIEGHRPIIVHKRSLDILHDPWFNKVNFIPQSPSILLF